MRVSIYLTLATLALLTRPSLAALWAPCSDDTACSDVPNSACLPYTLIDPSPLVCQCDKKYVEDTATGQCIGAIGQDCASTEAKASCNSIPYALCAETAPGASDLKCQCLATGYTTATDNTACQLADFRDRCLEDAQCALLHPNAKCTRERCECPSTLVPSENNNKCVSKLLLGLPCNEDVQCPEYAECSGLVPTCKCRANYVKKTNNLGIGSCLPISNMIGDFCEIDDQCVRPSRQANCVNGMCRCKTGEVPSLDKINCLTIASAGGPCQQNQQCPSGQVCTAQVCT